MFPQNFIEYYNRANEAEIEFQSKNFSSAKNILGSLEQKFGLLKPKDQFYYAAILFTESDSINGFRYLKKCAENGGFPSEELIHCKRMFVKNDIRYSNYLFSQYVSDSLIKIESSYLSHQDKTTRDTLRFFFEQDVLNRSNDLLFNKAYDDSMQMLELHYFKKHGFPSVFLYGDGFTANFIHITSPKVFKEYEPFLLEELKKGNIYPYYYAIIVDRLLYDSKNTTEYGTYINTCHDLKCRKRINKKRKSIGLSLYFNGPGIYPILDRTGMTIDLEN